MKSWSYVFFILFGLGVNAQDYRMTERYVNLHEFDQKRWGWGCYIGLNHFDFKLEPKISGFFSYDDKGRFAIEAQGGMGFTVGLMGKLRLDKYVDLLLEPGIHFVKRKIVFQNQENIPNLPDRLRADTLRNVQSVYLNIPLIVKAHGERFNNVRPFIAGGLGYAFNLESKQDKKEDNLDGVFRMKAHNFNWQAEAGIEVYFPHFKMVSSVKGLFFLGNELVDDKPDTPKMWAGSINSLQTRAIVFSLRFE